MAKWRTKWNESTVGQYGESEQNDNEERIIELCYEEDLVVLNTSLNINNFICTHGNSLLEN